jgi:indolepyruvate ferredoxin oxidoreductase
LPLEVRGFGHVKEASLQHAKAKEAELLARFRAPPVGPAQALAAAE